MDFFEHQERARRGTLWLVAVFIAAVMMVILAVYAAAIGIVAFVEARNHAEQIRLWIPELFAAVSLGTLIVITCGSLYKIWQIGGSGEQVALSLGGREINSNSRDLGERVLLNVVEEMALASGTPVPPVYVMDDESGINAFAAGTTPQNAVIGVTRGAITTLSRDQLQGVIGHEFSHILNGDMRLNIRLMGWLHGILLLAMIGYVLVRIIGQGGRYSSSSSSSSSSSNKKNEGGLVIVILIAGVALIAIGYIGVFFAQLIKAAVSRQREFLADASAVQFTRNPDGISTALMKIGGWKDHARVTAPSAEEASHMFFGSALASNLFATHPPLNERIRRIDPQFNGTFPQVLPVRHRPEEIIDPRSLSVQRSEATMGLAPAIITPGQTGQRDLAEAHAAAIAGAESVADHPESVVESIGQPTIEHIQQIHGLVDELEPVLATNIRDPLGALSVVYSLLLAPADSPVRKEQWAVLEKRSDVLVMSEVTRALPAIDRLAAEQRLPVACLALPALHQLSPAQTLEFQNTTSALIRMDNRTTLFEFAVSRFIAKRLVARLQQRPAKLITKPAIGQFQGDFTMVLSTLARVGDPANPQAAFSAGLQALDKDGAPLKSSTILDAGALSVVALDTALDHLESAAPKSKRSMLAAFTACIAADHRVAVQEAELLRVIADALGCPVPPILQ